MITLAQLKNVTRFRKKIQRVGRGPGSKRGKTSCRGAKGDKSRRGYDRRYGYEGGQVPLYRKLPIRGFTRGRFLKPLQAISLAKIEAYFSDNETVNLESLRAKGLIPRKLPGGIKILANGELNKKVIISANKFTRAAREKLELKSISFEVTKG